MIFTKVDGYADEFDMSHYHVEKVVLPSEDFTKRILRVTSDHGNEFGIRLDAGEELKDGTIFIIDDSHLLLLSVRREEYIEIIPRDMNEMGEVAHMIGNTHRPVVVENERIYLEIDPVVFQRLDKHNINYVVREIKLKKPLKHVDLSHVH